MEVSASTWTPRANRLTSPGFERAIRALRRSTAGFRTKPVRLQYDRLDVVLRESGELALFAHLCQKSVAPHLASPLQLRNRESV
jgi:hypothetical protein